MLALMGGSCDILSLHTHTHTHLDPVTPDRMCCLDKVEGHGDGTKWKCDILLFHFRKCNLCCIY